MRLFGTSPSKGVHRHDVEGRFQHLHRKLELQGRACVCNLLRSTSNWSSSPSKNVLRNTVLSVDNIT